MARAEITVPGLRDLVRRVKAAGPEMVDALKSANAEIAGVAAGYLRHEVPRKSGRLAGTIRTGRTAKSAVVSIGRARVPYTGPINYGWARHNIRPNPFIERANTYARSHLVEVAEKRLQDVADRLGGH